MRAEGGAKRYWWEAWDCMIAACATTNGVSVATRNIAEFEKFVPHGLKLLAVVTAKWRASPAGRPSRENSPASKTRHVVAL